MSIGGRTRIKKQIVYTVRSVDESASRSSVVADAYASDLGLRANVKSTRFSGGEGVGTSLVYSFIPL